MRSEARGATGYAWLPWLIAALGIAFDAAAFWPGMMSFDSAYAFWQARGAPSNNIVPPGFMLEWRALLWLDDGPAALFTLHLLLFWSGLALLANAFARTRRSVFAIMLVPALAPFVLLLRGHVWTDVGLLSSLVCASGVLACAHVTRRRRWLVCALPLLLHAAVMRHNALPAMLPFALWWAWLALGGTHEIAQRRRPMIAVIAGGLLLAMVGVNALLATRVDRREPLWPHAAEFDLAALSIATDRLLLPDFMVGPGLDVADLRQAFRVWSSLPLLTGTKHGLRPPFEPPLSDDERAVLRAAWFGAIADHPGAWLAHRWRVTCALLGTHAPDWPRELIYVDDEQRFRDTPAITPNGSALHAALMRRAAAWSSSAWLALWPYLTVGVVALPFAWRRRREPGGCCALLLLASAWLYALPLFALTATAESRYLGWSVVASLLAFACAVLAPVIVRADKLGTDKLDTDKLDTSLPKERP
jgi:hypothetical protein